VAESAIYKDKEADNAEYIDVKWSDGTYGRAVWIPHPYTATKGYWEVADNEGPVFRVRPLKKKPNLPSGGDFRMNNTIKHIKR
jgi:hypothetical protein